MKHALGAVAAGFIVAVAILLLSWTTYFAQLNSTAYDFVLRLAGPISPSSPTVIVAIDGDSLEHLGMWPWSRDKLARLIDSIQAGSPKVIAVDLLLDEKTTQESDTALAQAIANAPSIVLAAHLDSVNGTDQWRHPEERFAQRHVRLGHVHADPDFDGISRRLFAVKLGGGRAIRAFAVEALRGAGFEEKGNFDIGDGVANIIRPQVVNIRFSGDNNSFPHIPAWRVLDGSVQSEQFKDRIVLIGSTAEGLGDQWFTPFAETGRRMSGVEIHANAIETLYAGRSITEVSDTFVLVALFAMIILLWRLDSRFEGRPVHSAVILAAPAVGIVFASWMLMKYFNVWLPFPPFLAAVVVVVPALEVRKIIRVNRDLDGKIEKLTVAAPYESRSRGNHKLPAEPEFKPRILATLPDTFEREAWLAASAEYEKELSGRMTRRERLFGSRRHNSRWKLDAVDFFNEELMRFLSFNAAILASIEDVIIVSDPAGRVVYQNPAATRLDGYAPEPSFAPDYLSSLLDGRAFAAEFAGVIANGQPVTRQFVPGRSGRNFYNLTFTPISRSGVVLSAHDATAQFELNQAKNDMVSLVSHELRTPLTSIRGYSDMLLKYGLVKDEGREFLGTIIDESSRLNQLIQSFLDIAYIESGRQKITKSEFDIGPVLKDMLSIVGPVAAEKQIRVEALGDSSMLVKADRLLMYQALTNLVMNAIKYSGSGTRVEIRVANGDDRLRFRIADQGCGIPPEEHPKIFEKFYRRGNKETREQSGFGLGLAFVKEVATRHGGDVVVESEVGKGSTFTLWIPN